jgi:hypothetical protein
MELNKIMSNNKIPIAIRINNGDAIACKLLINRCLKIIIQILVPGIPDFSGKTLVV